MLNPLSEVATNLAFIPTWLLLVVLATEDPTLTREILFSLDFEQYPFPGLFFSPHSPVVSFTQGYPFLFLPLLF